VTLRGIVVRPGVDGEDLRQILERPSRRPPPEAPDGAPHARIPQVSLRDLVLEWPGGGGAPLRIGPVAADLDVERTPDGFRGSARLGLPGGGEVEARLRPGTGGTAFQLTGRASLHADIPAGLAAQLPVSFSAGSATIRASGRIGPGPRDVSLDGEVRARDVSLSGPRVGPVPLGPLELGASGRLAWDGAARRLDLAGGRLWLGESGEVSATVEGTISLRGERRFQVSAAADAIPWRALVDALPTDVGPPPTAPPVSGTLSARARVAGALSRRREWDVVVELDLEDLRRAARAAGPTWLSAPFTWRPIDPAPGEPPRRIAVGPGNPSFLPYAEAPAHLVRAVTASEDAGFFGHRGFDFREIANAIAERGRVRGASTISQQLAKNLFLSPERTLARKVREALGTIALEASVPKGRLLEIYLNIAEWGPGVYGAGEAAHFWFGKDPRDLTPRESAFLATVIPAPRRFHDRLHRSGITPFWQARIDDVLRKMRTQNALTVGQLDAALAEPLEPLRREHPPVDAGAVPGEPDPADEERASE
jgi:hypothetical protein